MLNVFREFGHSWIAKGFLVILVLSFGVFFGIGDIFKGRDPYHVVATVGPVEITRYEVADAVRNQMHYAQEMLGQAPTDEQVRAMHLPEMALNEKIQRSLLDQEAQRLHLTATDDRIREEIQSTKHYQTDGRFNRQLFDDMLRRQGMTEEHMIDIVRRDIAKQDLVGAISRGGVAQDELVNPLVQAIFQKKKVSTVTISFKDIQASASPGDATLQTFYKAHTADYIAPEKRTVEILVIDKANLSNMIPLQETDIKETIAKRSKEFEGKSPEAIRDIIVHDMKHQLIQDSGYTYARQIEDDMAGGMTLDAIAKKYNFAKQTFQNMEQGEVSPELKAFVGEDADTAVQTIFEMEDTGDVPLTEMKDGRFYIARLVTIIPAAALPYNQVANKVLQAWILDDQKTQATKKAAAIVLATKEKKPVDASFQPLTPVSYADLTTKKDLHLTAPMKEAIATLDVGTASMIIAKDSVMVVRIDGVVAPSSDEITQNKKRLVDDMKSLVSNELVYAYIEGLKERYPVTINGKALQASIPSK